MHPCSGCGRGVGAGGDRDLGPSFRPSQPVIRVSLGEVTAVRGWVQGPTEKKAGSRSLKQRGWAWRRMEGKKERQSWARGWLGQGAQPWGCCCQNRQCCPWGRPETAAEGRQWGLMARSLQLKLSKRWSLHGRHLGSHLPGVFADTGRGACARGHTAERGAGVARWAQGAS